MTGLFITIKDLYQSRKLLISLARNDFKNKFAGSYFGLLWSFVQPLATIAVFIFVFQVGFRSAPIEDIPFALWLTAGLVPWFFFAEAWNSATNSYFEYSFLVKKVVFKISIIPMIKVLSAMFLHTIFIFIMMIIFAIYGYYPNAYFLQLIYYGFAMTVYIASLSLITSSIMLFFKDLGQIINIILQFGMWLTPIMWRYTMIPEQYRWILKLNPMYYIVEGYRDSLIFNIAFWHKYNQTLWFWSITVILFVIGLICFKKLKPHFADVL